MQLKSVHPAKMQYPARRGGEERRVNGRAFISSGVLASVTSTARDYLRDERGRVKIRGGMLGEDEKREAREKGKARSRETNEPSASRRAL